VPFIHQQDPVFRRDAITEGGSAKNARLFLNLEAPTINQAEELHHHQRSSEHNPPPDNLQTPCSLPHLHPRQTTPPSLFDSVHSSSPSKAVRPDCRTSLTMPGFDFSNHNRNIALHARGVPLPKATSTGTTIVGCIFDNGVVVGLPPSHHHPKP
jgi:hypothetical protein